MVMAPERPAADDSSRYRAAGRLLDTAIKQRCDKWNLAGKSLKLCKLAGLAFVYCLAAFAVFLLSALTLGAAGYLVKSQHSEFLIHPLSVLIGLLFLYKMAQGYLAAVTRQHEAVMQKLEEIAQLQRADNIKELQDLREKLKRGSL